jgi:hypothetical protein
MKTYIVSEIMHFITDSSRHLQNFNDDISIYG